MDRRAGRATRGLVPRGSGQWPVASRQWLAMVRVVLPTSVCGIRFRVTSRVSFHDRQGVRIRAKTRATGSEPCCASLFIDSTSSIAGPVP